MSVIEQLSMESDGVIAETNLSSAQPYTEDIQAKQEEIKLYQDITDDDGKKK